MLKDFLREAFSAHLRNKRAWVSQQSFPELAVEYTPVVASNGNDNWGRFNAPSDGWIVVQLNEHGQFVDIENETRKTAICVPAIGGDGPVAAILPTRKGDQIAYHMFATVASPENPRVVFYRSLGTSS